MGVRFPYSPPTREGLLFRLQILADLFHSSECCKYYSGCKYWLTYLFHSSECRQNRLYPKLQFIPNWYLCPPEMPCGLIRWLHICVWSILSTCE